MYLHILLKTIPCNNSATKLHEVIQGWRDSLRGRIQKFCGACIHIQILHLNFTTRNYLFTNSVTHYIFFISSFLNKSK